VSQNLQFLGTRRTEKTVNWRLSIPEATAVKMELLLLDPSYHRPIYGLRSQVISNLIEIWLTSCEARIKAGLPIEIPGPGLTLIEQPKPEGEAALPAIRA
jgi:hypothetical protein